MASLSQIINSLPRPIRLRFDSISGFVQAIISEEERPMARAAHLTGEEREMVKLVVFCYAANRFFKEGSDAARNAVDELERFSIPGFQVGSTHFEGRNRNVMLGAELADHLMRSFDDSPLRELMLSASSMTNLAKTLTRIIRDEHRVG